MGKNTTPNPIPVWWELMKRHENFHGGFKNLKEFADKNNDFFERLYELNQTIRADLLDVDSYLNKLKKQILLQNARVGKTRFKEQSKRYSDMDIARNYLLEDIFTRIYKFVVKEHCEYEFFKLNRPLCMYDECLFSLLSNFLIETKKIESITIKNFLYKHSPNAYSNKESEFYFPDDYVGIDKRQKLTSDVIEKEKNTFTQSRRRAFTSYNPAYTPREKYNAIPKARENEYAHIYRCYIYDPDNPDFFDKSDDKNSQYNKLKAFYKEKELVELKKTHYKIDTLYNDIRKVRKLSSSEDVNYETELEEKSKKFLSKVDKLKYKDFLDFCEFELSAIKKDNQFYGIRLNLFEDSSRVNCIVNEVARLVKYNGDDVETDKILKRVDTLKDIYFPNLYDKFFSSFDDYELMFYHANYYNQIRILIIIAGQIIIDELVEKGYFGEEEWEDFFLKKTNELSERVFSKEVKYQIDPKSSEAQAAFRLILLTLSIGYVPDNFDNEVTSQ